MKINDHLTFFQLRSVILYLARLAFLKGALLYLENRKTSSCNFDIKKASQLFPSFQGFSVKGILTVHSLNPNTIQWHMCVCAHAYMLFFASTLGADRGVHPTHGPVAKVEA